MQGGLIPRLFQHLFERLRDSEREQREGLQLSYVCKVSCLEIYQVCHASKAHCQDSERHRPYRRKMVLCQQLF